jgi:hypothetical protein
VLSIPSGSNFSTDSPSGAGFTCAMAVAATFTANPSNASGLVNLYIYSGSATASVSGSYDTVDFTGYSGNPGTQTINCTSLFLSSGGTYTGLTVNLTKNAARPFDSYYTFSPNGKTITAMTVNTSNLYMYGAVTTATTSTTTLTAGTLYLQGYTLTTGAFTIGTASATNLQFAGSQVVLAHPTGQTVVLNMPNLSKFITDQTGSFSSALPNTHIFTCGTTNGILQGYAANTPNLLLTGSNAAFTANMSSILGSPPYNSFNKITNNTLSGVSTGLLKGAAYVNNYTQTNAGINTGLSLLPYGANSYISGSVGNLQLPSFALYSSLPSSSLGGTTQLTSNFTTANIYFGGLSTLDLNGYNMFLTANVNNQNASNGIQYINSYNGSGQIHLANNANWKVQSTGPIINMSKNVSIYFDTGNTSFDNGGIGTFGTIYSNTTGLLTIANTDNFYNVTGIPNANIKFTVGKTVTLNTFLTLGRAGSNINISSTVANTKANINLLSSGLFNYVSVKDTNITTNQVVAYNSKNGGNTSNIIFSAPLTGGGKGFLFF